jgi:hypothetical protein
MREIRTYGSEGGATGQPVVPTPIINFLEEIMATMDRRNITEEEDE